MAGEISNSYGSNQYGYNPYSTTNDDFLAQQYFAQLAQQKQGEPVFQGYQQPQADTFQKSGGIGWGTGLTLGSVAGLGTGAGMYFWGSNPIQDGKVADEILNAVEANNLEQTTIDKIKKLAAQRKQEILKKSGVPDGISLKTLKAYAKSGMPSAFPQLNGILTQEQAKKILNFVEHNRCNNFIISCHAGVSRSAGVCAALEKIYNGDDKHIFNSPKYVPNRWCYRKILDAAFEMGVMKI